MRAVIFSKDFEPITVVDLPATPEQIRLYLGDRIALPAYPKSLAFVPPGGPLEIDEYECKAVTLTMERMRWIDGSNKWIFVANCDETALLLEPAWLPGQQGEINRMEENRRALARMLLLAVSRGMRGGA